MKPTPIARRRWRQVRAWRRHAITLAALAALADMARADASQDGGVTPWFQRAAVVSLPGTVIDVGNRSGTDWGRVFANQGGRLLATGLRVFSGNLDVWDPGSFVSLSGPGSMLWVGYGRSGILNIMRGGAVELGGCGIGDCQVLIGGTTGRALTFDGAFPTEFLNGAFGDMIVTGEGSRFSTLGTFRVGQAYVGAQGSGIVYGTPSGTAIGAVRVDQGASLTTGAAAIGIGPSGPGSNGNESATGYVRVDGAGSTWTVVRNATTGVQAVVTLGAAGEKAGSQVTGSLNISNGAKVRIDGSSGGVLPGLVLGGGGASSAGFVEMFGAGSTLEFAGSNGYINIGGSGARGGGQGSLGLYGGALVQGVNDNALLFVAVGRNGSDGQGYLTIDGISEGGVRSTFELSGRGAAGGGAEGQSAYLHIARGGADGHVNVGNGGRLTITSPATSSPAQTVTGAGFSVGRDAGGWGQMNVFNGGEVAVYSSDRRPFVAVGQDGEGMLHIWGGGRADLLSGDAFASSPNSLLYVGGGGNGQSRAYGWLNIHGGGSLVQGPDNDNTLIAGSAAAGTAGAFGRIDVHDRGQLTTTALLLGVGTQGEAQMSVDNATVLLRGELTQAASSGAIASVGRGGGRGELHLRNEAWLTIDSAGSFAGLALGGSSTAPGGVGTMSLVDGARLEVKDRGRNDHGLWVGLAGTGTLYIGERGTAVVEGAGRVIIGAVDDAVGQVTVGSGGGLGAGRLLLGGHETPLAGGGGLVHANDWQPLALNQAPVTGQGASGYLGVRGGRVVAEHVGLALAAGSKGTIDVADLGVLDVSGTMMIGALGQGSLGVTGATVTLTHADASLVLGGFAGGHGQLGVGPGGQVQMKGSDARLDIGRGANSSGLASLSGGGVALDGVKSSLNVGVAGYGTLVLDDAAVVRAASMWVGREAGGQGVVALRDKSRLLVGSAGSGAGESGLGLGIEAGSLGQLYVDGTGSLLQVRGTSQTPVVVGDSGTGKLWITGGATFDTRSTAARPISTVVVGGTADSEFVVTQDSRAILGGGGNFVVASSGKANLYGQLDLRLSAPPPNPMVSIPPGGVITLPNASAAVSADRRYVSLTFDGHVPQVAEYVPLFAAKTIAIDPSAGIGTYKPVTIDGKAGYEFSVGNGQVSFRIQSPGEGLYPVLERSKESGNDVWGVRFIDQAVYVDWDQASSARVVWLKDAKDGVYRAQFSSVGANTLEKGAISEGNRNLVLEELSLRLRGDALATRGTANADRLGNALALPVFESRTLADAPANALVVRFAGSQQQPGCVAAGCRYDFGWFGYAVDTEEAGSLLPLDFGNQRKTGEVMVMADDDFIARRSAGFVATTLLHEVGHGLGLVHSAELSEGTLMSPPYLGYPSDAVLPWVERVDGSSVAVGATQNAMYHLLRYTFGWSEERLYTFGGSAGSLDTDLDELLALYSSAALKSGLDRIYNVLLLDPGVLAQGEEEWRAALYLPSASAEELATLSYVGLRGPPFKVLASSAPGDTLDLYFEHEEGSGLAGISGESLAGGRIMRIGQDGVASLYARYDVVSSSITPVPEPSTWLLFGAGGLMLAWRRRQRSVH